MKPVDPSTIETLKKLAAPLVQGEARLVPLFDAFFAGLADPGGAESATLCQKVDALKLSASKKDRFISFVVELIASGDSLLRNKTWIYLVSHAPGCPRPGKSALPGLRPRMEALLREAPSEETRAAVAELLGEWRMRDSRGALEEALDRDPDSAVRLEAAKALFELDPLNLPGVLRSFGDFPDSAMEVAEEFVKDFLIVDEERKFPPPMGEPMVDAIRGLLVSGKPLVRKLGARFCNSIEIPRRKTLGAFWVEALLPAIVPLLADENAAVRDAAANAIKYGFSENKKSFEKARAAARAAVEVLPPGGDPEVQLAVSYLLKGLPQRA